MLLGSSKKTKIAISVTVHIPLYRFMLAYRFLQKEIFIKGNIRDTASPGIDMNGGGSGPDKLEKVCIGRLPRDMSFLLV